MSWSLLDGLTEADRRQLLSTARRRRFARGEVVFHEGDPGNTVHLVVKGHFAVRITTPLGDVAMLRVHGPGGYFGELALLAGADRSATVSAITAGETLSLGEAAIAELRNQNSQVDRVLMDALISEVRRLSGALAEALYVPAPKRVVRRLLDLAQAFGAGASEGVVPVTQEELAQLAGTTRPTVNRVLRGLEDEGAVAVARGRVEVTDVPLLERRAR